jgi:kexin
MFNSRGESGVGTWTIVVKDTNVNEFNGVFTDWRLTLWGFAVDAAAQLPHPLPDEHDDDHNIEEASYATVSISPPASKTESTSPATDHPGRPVNEKPGDTEAKPTSAPEPTPTEDEVTEPNPTSDADNAETSEPSSSSFLPSFLPTFGVGPRTQIWIYASLSLIVVFCVALGIYFYVQRRKRLRNNPHDDYEFEMINEEDDAEAPLTRRDGRKRRGGELYNAFAEESDEDLLSEDDEEPYQDRPDAGFLEKPRENERDTQ